MHYDAIRHHNKVMERASELFPFEMTCGTCKATFSALSPEDFRPTTYDFLGENFRTIGFTCPACGSKRRWETHFWNKYAHTRPDHYDQLVALIDLVFIDDARRQFQQRQEGWQKRLEHTYTSVRWDFAFWVACSLWLCELFLF